MASDASVEALSSELAGAKRDQFELGDVIRWTAAGRYRYAAIKTEGGWYTTARLGNAFLPQSLSYEELVEVLQRSEVAEVGVARDWTSLG